MESEGSNRNKPKNFINLRKQKMAEGDQIAHEEFTGLSLVSSIQHLPRNGKRLLRTKDPPHRKLRKTLEKEYR